MKNKTARWLLCVVLALVLVASFVLVACKPDEEQPATYTLTFALGDHAAADAKAPDAIERKADEVVNLPNAPKAADGWEFDGWGSSKLAAGASFTMPAENTTLTAQWKQKPGPTPTTYTLTFALGDHAASDATAPEAKSYEAGAEVTLPDAPKADTGWQFDGWGDSKLAAGAKYTMPAQATTLTAQWKETSPAVTYTVTLKAGSAADEAEGEDQNITITDGNTYTFVDPTDKYGFSYEGYSFVGWKLEGDSTDKTYGVGDTYTFEGDVTSIVAYATWEEDEIPPFAEGAFHGVIVDMESGYSFTFTETEDTTHSGYYNLMIGGSQENMPLVGAYLYTNEGGIILVYVLVEDEPVEVGFAAIEEGNVLTFGVQGLPEEDAPSAGAEDPEGEEDVSDPTKGPTVELMAFMFKLSVTVDEEPQELYVNAGAPIYAIAAYLSKGGNLSSLVLDSKPLDLAGELDKVEKQEGYTEMPEADAELAITLVHPPFTTEAFNFDLSWEQKVTKSGSEVPVSVKLTAEKKSSSWSGELTLTSSDTDLDDYDTITFTMDANGSISLTSGMDKFSGTGKLAGNTLSITFTYKTYTFTCQADLIKLTFKNNSDEGEDKVIYANEGNEVDLSYWDLAGFSNTFTPEKYYFFNGWSDGDQTYGNDGVITVVKETTITPVWEKGYIVTFVVGVDESEIKQYHSQLSFYEDFVGAIRPSDAAKFVVPKNNLPYSENSDNYIYREGYDVTWKCSCHPGQTLNPSEEHALTGDVTFTATWTAIEYNVTYKLGYRAPEGTEVPEGGKHATDSTFALPGTLADSGEWKFAGWSDGTQTYPASSTYTMPAHDVIIRPVWKLDRTPTVADFYGIWLADETFEYLSGSAGEGLAFTAEGVEFKEEGYGFYANYEEADTSVADNQVTVTWRYSSTWTYTLTFTQEDIATLHGVPSYYFYGTEFTVKLYRTKSVVVHFNMGDGVSEQGPADQYLLAGATASEPTKPAREHYRFLGWYAADSEQTFDFETTISGDLTLTAKWEYIENVTVTFDSNAGQDEVSNMPQSVTKSYGETIAKPTETPTREGYEFQGWGVSKTSTVYFDFEKTQIKDNLTLFAIWKKIITITFEVEGGTTETPSVKVTEGTDVDLTKYTATSNNGHTFLGWKIKGNSNILGDKLYGRPDDTTLVAVFGTTYTAAEHVSGAAAMAEIVVSDFTIRDDGYVQVKINGSLTVKQTSSVYNESTQIYSIEYGYSGDVLEVKVSGSTFDIKDIMQASAQDNDKKVTVTFDGWGKVEASFDNNKKSGTYSLKVSDYKYLLTVTIGSDVSTFTLSIDLDYSTLSYVAKVQDGLLIVEENSFVFGDPQIAVTCKLSDDDDEPYTQMVPYGKKFVYDGEPISTDENGNPFYGWTKDGEDFDLSTPITAPVTLVAKYVMGVQYYVGEMESYVKTDFDEDGDGDIEITFPSSDDLNLSDYNVTGWVDYEEYGVADDIDECTVHKPGEKLTVNKNKLYIAVVEEKPFIITDKFNGAIPYSDPSEGKAIFDSDGNVSFSVISFSRGYREVKVSVTGTYAIADGVLTITLDKEFVDEGWSVFVVDSFGRQLTVNVTKDADVYAFGGVIYKLTIKNYDVEDPDATTEMWYAAGTDISASYGMDTDPNNEDDGFVASYKINGTEYTVEELMTDDELMNHWLYMPEEDVTIEYVRGKAAPAE